MQDSIRALLRNKDPKQRMQGIKQIVQNPNANTKRILATIAQKDPDSTVRLYAKQMARQVPDAPGRNPADIMQEANLFLDEANNAMFEENVKEARTFARRAFQLAPQLQNDDLARDIAVYVMKMNADEAIELLLSDRDLFEADRAFRKKMGYSYSDEGRFDRFMKHFSKWDVTWEDAAIDVGLYIVSITLPMLIVILLAGSALATSFATMSTRRLTGQAALIENYMSAADFGSGAATLGFALGTVLLGGAIFFGIFAFQMLMSHFSALWFLGGDGSLRRLIHHAFIPVTLYSYFLWLTLILTPLFYAMGMGLLVESGMMEFFNLIAFGVFIYVLSGVIGRVYQFDTGKGCLSLAFPYVVFGCTICSVVGLRFGTVVRQIFAGG